MIGIDDPDVDVEMIELLCGFCRDLGLRDVRLLLNSMGDAPTRARYREVLLDVLARARGAPRRGDGARGGEPAAHPRLQAARLVGDARAAPQLGEYLSDASAAHFARVQEGLQAIGIPFEIAPRLVRGFDYYTSTVFELASDALDAAQNAIGGGGRYDKLAQEMGGPEAPSIGFGSGIERLLLACDAEGVFPVPRRAHRRVRRRPGRDQRHRAPARRASRVGPRRRPCVRRPFAEEAVHRGRPIGRTVGRHHRRRRGAAGHGRGQGPAFRSTADRSAARGDRGVVADEEGRSTPMMRSHRGGDLRVDDIGSLGGVVRLGREPARPRRQGVPRRPRRRRTRAGRGRPAARRPRGRAPAAQRMGGASRRRRRRPARRNCQRRTADGRGRGRRPARSRCCRSRSRRRSRSTTASTSTRRCACVTAISICDARRCSATSGCAPRSTSSCASRWPRRTSSRSRRRCSSRRRPRARATSWCRRACVPASSTRCRRARSSSSSC